MGTSVTITVDVKIPLSKEKELKGILKKLADVASTRGRGSNGQKKHFSYTTPGFEECESLEESFECLRYVAEVVDNVLVISQFSGETLGEDHIIWKYLAPVVESGSFIESQAEYGELTRWQFENGKIEETCSN